MALTAAWMRARGYSLCKGSKVYALLAMSSTTTTHPRGVILIRLLSLPLQVHQLNTSQWQRRSPRDIEQPEASSKDETNKNAEASKAQEANRRPSLYQEENGQRVQLTEVKGP